jgi:hypothetical protein
MPVHNGYTEAETCSTFGNCRTENGPCSKYFSIYADDDDVFVFVLFSSFAVVLDAVVVVVIIIATAARLVQNAFGFSLSRNTFSPVVIGSGLVVVRTKVVSSSSSSSSMVVVLFTSKNSSLEAALVVVVSRRRFLSMMVLPPLEGKRKFPEVQDDIRLILLFLPRFLASRIAVVVILLRAVVVVA